MEVVFRNYVDGDETNILDLFQQSFNRNLELSYWKWRYKDNVLNKYLIRLAMEHNTLAAHYALSPTRLYIDGKIRNSALSMTTMTHPDYRGLGLFTKLASELFDMEKDSLEVIYGVANENSLKGFLKYLQFSLIKDISIFEINLANKVFSDSLNCNEITKFDSKFDELMKNISRKYKVILSRDSRYLNWRFITNPTNNYKVFSYEKNGELLGYVITKVYKNGEIATGDIVDILSADKHAFISLIEKACLDFCMNNITNVKMWMTDEAYIRILNDMGFKSTDEKFHFIVRNNSEFTPDSTLDFSNWYVTMSDIDIF